jgi:hypothetical protein
VICSQTTPGVRDGVMCWVKMLIVGEEIRAVVSTKREAWIAPNITLTELDSVVDKAKTLAKE